MTCRKITNDANAYAWGSESLIPAFMGTNENGKPQAEVWLGTHPISTARFIDTDETIDSEVSLRFLVKILAAAKPLSIQVHPSKEQAEYGFVRENILNIHRNAFNRNYKDDNHKPEMLIAIKDGFKALCGFRKIEDSLKALDLISKHTEYSSEMSSILNFKTLVTEKGNENMKEVLSYILESPEGQSLANAMTHSLKQIHNDATVSDDIKILCFIASHFPNDVGIAVAVLMNPVILKKGEALFLPAGNVHAYIEGIGLEVMTESDNVLRGGLTTKYIDVEELLKIVDTSTLESPIYNPEIKGNIKIYNPMDEVTIVEAYDSQVELNNKDCIAVALTKSTLTFNNESVELEQGESVLIREEEYCSVKGHAVFSY
jgi:mannose-6-phosphate isomerase